MAVVCELALAAAVRNIYLLAVYLEGNKGTESTRFRLLDPWARYRLGTLYAINHGAGWLLHGSDRGRQTNDWREASQQRR